MLGLVDKRRRAKGRQEFHDRAYFAGKADTIMIWKWIADEKYGWPFACAMLVDIGDRARGVVPGSILLDCRPDTSAATVRVCMELGGSLQEARLHRFRQVKPNM